MCKTSILTAALVCVTCLGGTLSADFYDNFDDGHYWQDANDEPFDMGVGAWPWWNSPEPDPGSWDANNPHQKIFAVMCQNGAADASDGWLRVYAQQYLGNDYLIGAMATDGDVDPNTSATYFDDSAPHYIIAKMKSFDTTKGEHLLLLHAAAAEWTAWCSSVEVEIPYPNDDPNLPPIPEEQGYFKPYHVDATDWDGSSDKQYHPELNFGTGFWMLLQFEGDGDPNNSYLRTAVWNGGKFDRDPNNDMYVHIVTEWDPNEKTYWKEGLCGVATVASGSNGKPTDIDAKFDEIECRWGIFDGTFYTLDVSFYHGENGSVTFDPDPLSGADPNVSREYASGTEVSLTAVPNPGKIFLKWKVTPSVSASYEDTNMVAYLTMDEDYEVECQFKCGSSVPPFVAMTLLALGVGVLLRRWT